MRKIFAKIIVAILLVFLGIVEVSASYTAVPVKQYRSVNGFYSDWYLQYRNELSKEYNGKLYSSTEYQKHFALWLRVEGLTEKQVNKNPNKILTVPVSGKLAVGVDKYVVLSDNGESVPTTVIMGEKTYVRDGKLYTVELQQEQIFAPKPTVTVTPVPLIPVLLPDTKTEYSLITPSFVGWITAFVLLGWIGWMLRKETKIEKKEIAEKQTEIEFHIREEDAVLLEAIQKAGNLTVRDGNMIHLPLMEDGKVALPGNIPVKNANKNIRDGLIQAYVKKNK